MIENRILILDYGSQYTQLIARRIRELNVFSEISNYDTPTEKIKKKNPSAIILSGGPMSVYNKEAYKIDRKIFELNIPILGICYGMQLIMNEFGSIITESKVREYGKMNIKIINRSSLFEGINKKISVWMSHGDKISSPDGNWKVLASSENNIIAAVKLKEHDFYGVQFHPEVIQTEQGLDILKNFIFEIAKCKASWTSKNFTLNAVKSIKNKVGNNKIVCGISGGVDSTVMAVLINEAIGNQSHFIFVNHGLLRKNEESDVINSLKNNLGMQIKIVDASIFFFRGLKGVTDPEQKRKVIGKLFIDTFEKESKKIGKVKFLAQGTLYPDIIESGGSHSAVTIKSHHNVGGLPENLKFKLVEPLKSLFKDEVREVGKNLKIPDLLIDRHPFPGPGLAVRIIGEVNENRVKILQDADEIFIKILRDKNQYNKIWQAFCVLIPIKTVGVMGDGRTYENLVALRAVTSVDGMTADWYKMPNEILEEVSSEIINNVRGVNRVVYDVTSKPPGTIEWE